MSKTRHIDGRIAVGLAILALVLGGFAAEHGPMFFPDEQRYFYLTQKLLLVLHSPFVPVNFAFGTDGRSDWLHAMAGPLYYPLAAPFSWIGWLAHGVNPQTESVAAIGLGASWFRLPAALAVLSYAACSLLVFRLGERLLPSARAALLAQALFILWPQHLLYARHLVPYLPAELFLLLSALILWRALQNPQRLGAFAGAGALWTVHLLIYMGFYYTLLGFLAVILLQQAPWRLRIKNLLAFLTPAALAMGLLELISQAAFQESYLAYIRGYATTVTMGDLGQGWRFPWEYGAEISPALTAVMLLGTLGILVAWLFKKINFPNPLVALALMASGFYLWLVLHSDVLARMVIYARTLLPLVVLGLWLSAAALIWLWQSRQPLLRWSGFAGMALSVAGLLSGGWELFQVAYPQDQNALLEYQVGTALPERFLHSSSAPDGGVRVFQPRPDTLVFISRTVSVLSESPVSDLSCRQLAPAVLDAPHVFLALNREFIAPIRAVHPVRSSLLESGQVLFMARHPLLYPLYQYEGYTAAERDKIRQANLQMVTIYNPCRPKN